MGSGLFPHAVVRSEVDFSSVRSAGGRPLRSVEVDGIALVGAPPEDPPPTAAPAAYMDAVSDLASLAGGACVPMRAVDRPMSERDARSFLRSGLDRFERLLGRLEGREEWSVRLPGTRGGARPSTASGSGLDYLEERRRTLALEDGVEPGRVEAVVEAQRLLARRVDQLRVIGRGEVPSIAVLLAPEDAVALERLAERERWALCGPYPAFSFVSIARAS